MRLVDAQVHGRQVHGQQMLGRQVYGQQVLAQQVHGQQVHGQQVYGQQVPDRRCTASRCPVHRYPASRCTARSPGVGRHTSHVTRQRRQPRSFRPLLGRVCTYRNKQTIQNTHHQHRAHVSISSCALTSHHRNPTCTIQQDMN